VQSFAVSESSGSLDTAQKIGLQRTHFDMNKFGKPTEDEYMAVRDVIEEMVQAAIQPSPLEKTDGSRLYAMTSDNNHAPIMNQAGRDVRIGAPDYDRQL
jgi:hypothetical protein